MGIHFPDPKRIANDAINHTIRPAVDGMRHGIENLAHGIEGNLNNLGHQIEGQINQKALVLKNEIGQLGHTAELNFKSVAHAAEGDFSKLVHSAEGGFKQLAKETETAFTDTLPKLVEAALNELLKELSGKLLNQIIDIIQIAVPDEMEIQIGPVTFALDDVNDRIDTLQKWAKNPPGKDDVKEMIITIAPSKVSIVVSAEMAALVVTSKSLGVGTTMSWGTDKFLDKFDDVFDVL